MWKPVQVLVFGLVLVTGLAPAVSGKRLLAIFAHPDDEGIVGPLLARYAREKAEVHLALVTSGQKGKRPWVQTPAGEALGREREQEAACACRAYGIHPPILLRFQDGAVTGAKLARLAAEVRRLFVELRPDVVITWGPEGLYGHPDHRLVGAVVTEVFQSSAAGPKALFYPGIPARRLEQAPAPNQMSVLLSSIVGRISIKI
jgi:LmbE family N-acetylglucosaminyl deacetylase